MYDSENDREYLPEEIEEDTDEQSSDCSDIERPTKKKDYCQITCCIASPPPPVAAHTTDTIHPPRAASATPVAADTTDTVHPPRSAS